MQIYVQKESNDDKGNTVWFGLKDPDSTIIEPVIEQLNKNEDVIFARYIVNHPDLDDHILEVKVRNGNPRDAVKKAAEEVGNIFKGIGIE